MQRLNESLIARSYVTWFDLTNMKGSTMDAMSDAIEGADVMLYGVSLAYKESANVRFVPQGMFHQLIAIYRGWSTDSACCRGYCTTVPIGGQLRSSARAGHDPTDDAGGLFSQGLV